MEQVQTEQAVNLDKEYANTMDSVNLLASGKPVGVSDSDWDDTVQRNKAHIQIMIAKDYWVKPDGTSYDLTALHGAVA